MMKVSRFFLVMVFFVCISIFFSSCKDDEILPPLRSTGVSATAGDGQITISWNDSQGALSYNIYWSENAEVTTTNGTLISNVVSPYTHTGLTFGTTYYYIVTAENSGGESNPSNEVNAEPGCIDVPSGLVSWWPADGHASDFAGDHATLQRSVSFAEGKVGQAFDFDGSLQDNVYADVSGVRDLQQQTVEGWILHRSLTTKMDTYLTIAGDQTEKVVIRHDGLLYPSQLHFYMDINGTLSHVRANNVLQVGVWHHVAGTYDGSIMRMYLDGVEVENLAVSGTVAAGSIVLIGGSSIATMDGLIDEMSIYNRALTSAEVLAIYNADITGKCK
jgi:hypothetical protein